MDYNKDFTFYLLPSRVIFDEYIMNNNVEHLTKKDFETIIDVALKAEPNTDSKTNPSLITESNVYLIKDKLIKLLEEAGKHEYVEKLNKIYESHMGARLIFDLYNFNFIPRSSKSSEEAKIQSTIDLNNLPMKDIYTDKELKKLKKP